MSAVDILKLNNELPQLQNAEATGQYENYTGNIFTYYEYEFFETDTDQCNSSQYVDEKMLIANEYVRQDSYDYSMNRLGSYWPLQSAAMPLVR